MPHTLTPDKPHDREGWWKRFCTLQRFTVSNHRLGDARCVADNLGKWVEHDAAASMVGVMQQEINNLQDQLEQLKKQPTA